MNYQHALKQDASLLWSYWFNMIALVAVCGSLVVAFYWQIAFNELPCPLCQLQRVGLILAGIGFMLNLRFGPSAVHYAIILASAMGGAAASMRQVLLHIMPGDTGYGTALFGLHFYTWGLISFIVMMIFCAVMLCIDRNNMKAAATTAMASLTAVIIYFFFALTAANVVSSVMVCKFGACPDNPTEYVWKF